MEVVVAREFIAAHEREGFEERCVGSVDLGAQEGEGGVHWRPGVGKNGERAPSPDVWEQHPESGDHVRAREGVVGIAAKLVGGRKRCTADNEGVSSLYETKQRLNYGLVFGKVPVRITGVDKDVDRIPA